MHCSWLTLTLNGNKSIYFINTLFKYIPYMYLKRVRKCKSINTNHSNLCLGYEE